MSFNVAADAYDRFMGRYSRHLAPQMADLAGISASGRAIDVGCGPGALTSELVARLGASSVAAVDPSTPFVEAARERNRGVDVRQASADDLPFADASFDAALAQLVVHFMPDPVAGLREMARVTRPGGIVAACVWDHAGGEGPLGAFWDAARQLDRAIHDESDLPGARRGHLGELFAAAGLGEVEESSVESRVEHPTFDDWWAPFTGGVGPAGAYVASLGADAREALRARCETLLPPPPFVITARAWAARGIVA